VDVASTGREEYLAGHIVLGSSVVLEAEVEQCHETAEPDCSTGPATGSAPAARTLSEESHSSAIDSVGEGALASGLVVRQHSMVGVVREVFVPVADAAAAADSGCT
jgi:hypothetical protein